MGLPLLLGPMLLWGMYCLLSGRTWRTTPDRGSWFVGWGLVATYMVWAMATRF